MLRKRKQPTPHFKLPAPFQPITGQRAPLIIPGFYPYCAMMQEAAGDTHTNYVLCRGFDVRILKFIDYDEADLANNPGIPVAKPYHSRIKGLFQVAHIFPAFLPLQTGNPSPNPEPLHAEIEAVRGALGRVPVLGICLGHQLLGLATGHQTYKLPFGHRGANHPVLERRTGRVLVTSQNHGFAVRPSDETEATHISLYDGTVEGFDFPELRARSVQFHPEAGPGPHDAWPILERFVEEIRG